MSKYLCTLLWYCRCIFLTLVSVSYDWWNENIVKAEDIKKRREGMKEMYVPSEIVREIFLSLPCKSLCRFRSISKQYHSYINGHQFMEEYRKRNMKPSHLLIWDTTIPTNLHLFNMSMDSYAYIKTIPTYKYKIASPSLHGMVFLHKWNSREIALFNPSSGEIIPLPDCTKPFECFNNLGFGFEPKSRRYKIVQLIVRSYKVLRFHILTVTHNDLSWRPVNVSNESVVFFRCQPPICVDGVLYWEVWIEQERGLYTSVFDFDLGTEEIKIIQSPVKLRAHLALLEGALCCYGMNRTDMLLMMNIWKLEHDVNNNVDWTLCYKLEIYSLNSKSPLLIPLYIYDGKRILFQDQFSGGFYCYNIEDKRLKIYPLIGNVEGIADSSRVTVHSETVGHPLD